MKYSALFKYSFLLGSLCFFLYSYQNIHGWLVFPGAYGLRYVGLYLRHKFGMSLRPLFLGWCVESCRLSVPGEVLRK